MNKYWICYGQQVIKEIAFHQQHFHQQDLEWENTPKKDLMFKVG